MQLSIFVGRVQMREPAVSHDLVFVSAMCRSCWGGLGPLVVYVSRVAVRMGSLLSPTVSSFVVVMVVTRWDSRGVVMSVMCVSTWIFAIGGRVSGSLVGFMAW